MRKTSVKRIIAMIMCVAMLSAMFAAMGAGMTVGAAARPIVIDFSRDDWVMNDPNADAIIDIVNIDGRRVIRVEIVQGADLDDPENSGGDGNATVADFADYELDADVYQWIRVSYRNLSDAPYFEFHFASPTSGFAVATSFNIDIQPQSAWSYTVAHVPTELERFFPKRPEDVPDPYNFVNHWAGMISNLRLDFMYYEEPGGRARLGDVMYVEYIAFFDSEEAARAFEFTPARTVEAIEQAEAEREAEREAARQAAEEERLAREQAAAEAAAQQQEAEGGDDDDTAATDDDVAPTTTAPPAANDDDGGLPVGAIIGIIAGVVVVVCIIIVVATKKKK